ncbi:MAG: HesA/MoeB/ThiF family protein [Bacteroidetes bacterium]|nr:HesA/MoeB/ThiF family protein [Bacteroidota bacterium]MCL5025489.1 HesA/MoeB/ThiF family protein [Chloroflexota bacterium]
MLKDEERRRYDRQMRIQGFGLEGQEKLKKARVLVAGAGGLGCPLALYLAAAGVGSIRLVDRDRVDPSNLNRQVLHWTPDVGVLKVESAAAKLRQVNPNVAVEPLMSEITAGNIDGLVADRDLIVDAMDNYATRYLLNEAAIRKRIPYFHGSIYGFEGMTTTIIPGKSACLRCLFAQGPPPAIFPVLGTTPGIIGLIQATEVVKYITGLGELLIDRLLIFDGLAMSFREVRIKRRPDCVDCGSLPAESA